MKQSWFVLADDLTGAADCAIAFAKNGMVSDVLFESDTAAASDAPVLAVDAASRPLPAAEAAQRHAALLERHFRKGMRLYKKLDSLLRGQPAAETAAAIRTLRGMGGPAFVVMAPAFPATGRTTVNGRVLVNGMPLENTEVWARDHTYANGDLAAALKPEGLNVRNILLADVRKGAQTIAGMVAADMDEGFDGVVCDAETLDDLAFIAEATHALADRLFWVGTGGLAVPLARMSRPEQGSCVVALPQGGRGLLLVVGSVVKVSREALRHVLASQQVEHYSFTPQQLLGDAGAALAEQGAAIAEALAAGKDVAVEIAEVEHPNMALGGRLAASLARVLHNALESAAGLVVTGGETAANLMAEVGIHGIRLVAEVESGVPAGMTLGNFSLPIVTKAGSFGTERTLASSLDFLRAAIKKGELA
ncbi:four-carbon acid sugar kinase family protein [Desulfovibrio sp.]|uniref:four-carbon acid sugar kinase family protein n=1 Tax=Desulfovibrio sp. TaxID=885 RepID=UPI0025C4B817|nr:four-carbon acid sugar kinase family protein [Desulfovibrio sp.]